MSETSKLPIRVTPRLKGKIAGAVKRQQRNMNGVIVGMLAEHYGVPYEAAARAPGREVGAATTIMLYLPADIRDLVDLDAQGRGETARDVIVRIISEKLGEPFQPGGRWPQAASA